MKVSNCCFASPCNQFEEEGLICGECKEHCDYIDEEQDELDTAIQREDWQRKIYAQIDAGEWDAT